MARAGGRPGPLPLLLDEAEALHRAQLVCNSPMLDHLSVLEPDDVEDIGLHHDAGWRASREGAEVGSAAALPRPDLVPVDDHLVDRDGEVGEGAPQVADRALDALLARLRAPLVLDASGATISSTTARLP